MKKYPELKNFLGEVEKASLEMILAYKTLSLDWLIEWIGDAKGIYESLEEVLECKVPSECPTFDLINLEQRKRVEKLIEHIPFSKVESHDRLILLELVVLQPRYRPIQFYSTDNPFLERAKDCLGILEKNDEVKRCSLHFNALM
jgi:hypothetical protein